MEPPRTPATPWTALTAAALARRLRALSPSLGDVRLVAVDGHAGSGKSVLTTRLSRALDGAPVVRLDDLASHGHLFDWPRSLEERVLGPLGRGEVARHRVYDWRRREFSRVAQVPPAPVVLLDGVGSGRRALRGYLASLIWLEVTRDTAWARGEARDGPEQEEFWHGWKAAERAHFSADPSRPYADLLVTPRGGRYAVRPGPGSGPKPPA